MLHVKRYGNFKRQTWSVMQHTHRPKGARERKRLTRQCLIADARVQDCCRSLSCAQGNHHTTTDQHDPAHRDDATLQEIPKRSFLHQHVALQRNIDGGEHTVGSNPNARIRAGEAFHAMRTAQHFDRRAKSDNDGRTYLEEMACFVQPWF